MIAPSINLKLVLAEFRAALTRALGERLAGAYLFGSQARGDATPDSDIDVLVVVRGPFAYGEMLELTSISTSELSLKHDTVISRAFVSEDEFARRQSPFLMNVRREAVPI